MEFELRLPDVGEGVAEGEIVRWLVSEGDRVREDDLLVEVLTDKANVEIPSPVSGILSRIVAPPGRIIRIGEVMAVLDVAGEPAWPAERPPGAGDPAGDVLAVPAVRRLAKELGVEISSVRGTGPDGRVTERDLRAAAGHASSYNFV